MTLIIIVNQIRNDELSQSEGAEDYFLNRV